MTLVPTLKLSLEMTNVLTHIEMNGLKINLDTLDEIEKEYNEELSYLETKLQSMARQAMVILLLIYLAQMIGVFFYIHVK